MLEKLGFQTLVEETITCSLLAWSDWLSSPVRFFFYKSRKTKPHC